MKVTVTEIARQAGVSKGLVSRVLNNDQTVRISEGRRRHIQAIRDSLLNGISDQFVRPVRKRPVFNFVIPCINSNVLEELKSHWENDTFRNFKSILASKGFRISIALLGENEGVKPIVDLMNSPEYCDGLVLLGGISSPDIAANILERRFPHICMDFVGRQLGLNTVFEDAESGLGQSVRHLYELGHRRIGFLGRRYHHYALFLSAMTQWGLEIRSEWNCANPKEGVSLPSTMGGWRETARVAFGEWLDEGHPVTAMVCHNDYGTLGAIDAMRERGLVPGRDISLIGFDNIEANFPEQFPSPLLTTVDFSFAQVGRRCGELLINQVLHSQMEVIHEYVPVKLILRESTGPCPV
jgi:LacI family transcriptional regulator